MFKILIMLLASCLVACGNKIDAKVPENVNTQVQVQPVTGEIVVRHIIAIELPTVFTDSCRTQFPADEAAYQKCVTDYINQIIKIVGGINPNQLPVIP